MVKKKSGRQSWAQLKKKYFRWKLVVVAMELAFTGCFFIGIFSNSSLRMPTFKKNQWFYINRGYPVAWAGVTKENFSVDFPLIKAPLIYRTIESEGFNKIIDLRIFGFLYLIFLVASYPVVYFFYRAVMTERGLTVVTWLLLLPCLLFYFLWFPRI